MSEKSTVKCKTPAKAQKNFKKHQRTKMNRLDRRANNQKILNQE